MRHCVHENTLVEVFKLQTVEIARSHETQRLSYQALMHTMIYPSRYAAELTSREPGVVIKS
ncbi:hypothetical protein RRF57_001172 [Xylaria bambusicola]|uniref:Uncharacterized protein n=1 Tax=Xylaria bambusicola TaxID=326684 RepID=A0AAN7UGX4_9PEZI